LGETPRGIAIIIGDEIGLWGKLELIPV